MIFESGDTRRRKSERGVRSIRARALREDLGLWLGGALPDGAQCVHSTNPTIIRNTFYNVYSYTGMNPRVKIGSFGSSSAVIPRDETLKYGRK